MAESAKRVGRASGQREWAGGDGCPHCLDALVWWDGWMLEAGKAGFFFFPWQMGRQGFGRRPRLRLGRLVGWVGWHGWVVGWIPDPSFFNWHGFGGVEGQRGRHNQVYELHVQFTCASTFLRALVS